MRKIFCQSNLTLVFFCPLLLGFQKKIALPTLMNPGKDIAVSKPENDEVGSVVTNANLYFFAYVHWLLWRNFFGSAPFSFFF